MPPRKKSTPVEPELTATRRVPVGTRVSVPGSGGNTRVGTVTKNWPMGPEGRRLSEIQLDAFDEDGDGFPDHPTVLLMDEHLMTEEGTDGA